MSEPRLDDVEKDIEKDAEHDETPPALSTQETPPTHNGQQTPLQQSSPETAANAEHRHREIVQFGPGDPEDPKNFSFWRKAWFTFVMSMLAFLGLFGTSVIAPAEPIIAEYVNVSVEATTLLAALYILGEYQASMRRPRRLREGAWLVAGFALGPMIWAPLSELYGRRWSILPPTFILGLFCIGTAVSKNFASLLVTRFFAGVFASAATSISPAALGDIYEPRYRATAMGFWTECVIGGPTLAPIIGAAVVVNKHMGWRCRWKCSWEKEQSADCRSGTEYIEAIMVFFIFAVALLFMPETYAPTLLKRKAKRLQKLKGEKELEVPEVQPPSFQKVFATHLSRPLQYVQSPEAKKGLKSNQHVTGW
jgi:MFS family permease